MKKLRLLVTERCPRSCPGCCNKDWDLDALEVYDPEIKYEIIMITGGEPLVASGLLDIIIRLRMEQPQAKLYMYTAGVPGNPGRTFFYMQYLDGMCYTLHEQADVTDFGELRYYMSRSNIGPKLSLKLNIFKGIDLWAKDYLEHWQVRDEMEWSDDCSLPDGEEFRRWV